MTRDEAISKARADFAAAEGRIVETPILLGYVGNDSVERYFDPPIKVRVEATPPDDLEHDNDGWIDPYWNVEPLDPCDLRSTWIDGPSYQYQKETR